MEELGGYLIDVIVQSTRPGNLSAADLRADPVFSLHPAVAAGQIFGRNQDIVISYLGVTIACVVILQSVQSSSKVT